MTPPGGEPRGKVAATRYVIRNAAGEELTCPSLADLHALYNQGFLADDDQVRMERSERWVPAGDMPALHGVRQRRRDPKQALALLAAVAVLVLAIAILVQFGR